MDAAGFVASGVIGLLAASAQAAPRIIDDAAYMRPQRLVEIEPGRRLNLYCIGQGRPTVILESGIASPILVWGLVQPDLAKYTRTCAYDRAGFGFSDASPRPSTAANAVYDLHRLLEAANVTPPYLLVGASAGGMYTRLYTSSYPREVVGLVLVDPSHENQRDEWWRFREPSRTPQQWEELVVQPDLAFRRACVEAAVAGNLQPGGEMTGKCIDAHVPQFSEPVQKAYDEMQSAAPYQRAWCSEFEAFMTVSAAQVRAARHDLGDLPLIVLTRDLPARAPSGTAEQTARAEAWYQVWLRLHRDLADISSRSQIRIVEGSGHDIELDKPQAVIDAVREVLALSRSGSRP